MANLRDLEKQYRPGFGNPIPKMNAADLFPQLTNEPDIVFGVRRTLNQGVQGLGNMGIDLYNAIGGAFDTPAKRTARQPKPADAFPVKYTDQAYSEADANAARITGVPVQLLNRLRLQGERSNADQTSSAGAKTPYQITPQTRAGIMKNYGIDPWSSPQNAALGAAYVAWEQAGRPKPDQWNNERVTRAVGGYFGGAAGAANPFGGLSDGGTTVGEYTQRVLGPDTGLHAPFLNPYDPRYDRAALGELENARQAMMTPSSFSVAGPGPAPELPEPEPLPTTDFSKVDEALQAMKPVEITEKEKLSRERQGFWTGIGKAMMQSSGNEGLGTFLMHLGGAALSGRMAAKEDLRAEHDRFETKMAQFRAAVFQNELGKAKVHADEAQAQVQQNNNFAMNKWKVAYDSWKGAGGSVDISGTNAVVTRKDPNGNLSVNVLPIAGAVNAFIAKQRSEIFQSVGGRQFAGNQQITGMENAIVGRLAVQSMTSGVPSAESDAAAAAAPAAYATFITTHGGVADLLGPDGAKSLEETVQKQLMSQQIVPGSKEWIERHDTLVATELTKLGIASPEMMKRMMQVGGAMSSFRALENVESAKVSQRTDPKTGLATTTTNMRASDIFDSEDFNRQLAEHGYTRR